MFNTGIVVSLRKARDELLIRRAKRSLFPYRPEAPWPLPQKDNCILYHSMDLPNGETLEGAWDIRGVFEDYIGNYRIAGKTVLDVGTASGFLAFEAEKAGAIVTAVDACDATEIRHIQHLGTPFHSQRYEWLASYDDILFRLKNSFWYAHKKLDSRVDVIYAPIDAFPYWSRRFDVVIAGAIIEHLSDPVTSIGNMAMLAGEAVIIPFTPVEDTDDQIMLTANDWQSTQFCYTWWTLSRGMYKRIFENLGFDVAFEISSASTAGQRVERPTIVARRR